MYKQALKTYKEIFLIILIAALLVTIASVYVSSSAGTAIVTALIAFYAHRNILTGEKINFSSGFKQNVNKDANFNWTFAWRFVVLFLAPIIVSLLFILPIGLVGVKSETLNASYLLLFMYIIVMAAFSMTMALFGSALPAASVKSDSSFSSAFKRGAPKFWQTVWKFFYGPFLFSFLIIIANVIIFMLFPPESLRTSQALVIDFAIILTSSFSITLTAAILSQTYMEYEGITAHKSDNLGN